MKKLLLALLLLPTIASAQWFGVGNTLQRTADTYNYRFNLGSPGFMYLYTKPQVDSLLALAGGLPSQTGQSGKFLTTNGTSASWAPAAILTTNTFTGLQKFNGGAQIAYGYGLDFVSSSGVNGAYIYSDNGAIGNKSIYLSHQNSNTDTLAFLSNISGSLSGYAKLASPLFTGIPTAPTATVGTNTTQLATTAFVLANGYTLPSFTQYSVPIATGSTLTQDNNNFYYNYSTHQLSVGTNGDFTGTNAINIYGQMDAYEPQSAIGGVTSSTAFPGVTASTSRGTGASPSVNNTGDYTGGYSGWGYTGASPAYNYMAGMAVKMVGGTSSLGGQLEFYTKADGSTTTTLWQSIGNDGTITFPKYNTGSSALVTNGSGVVSQLAYSTTPTASNLAQFDANANLSANNEITGYTTTATAAGTTTLTVSSTYQQYFTGTSTQTVVLPVASTLVNGMQFVIVNNSTGNVTVNTSGSNTIQAMVQGTTLSLTCINTAGGTGTASWNWTYTSSVFPTVQSINIQNLGQTTAAALNLENTTAATVSVQQWSPALVLTGNGWSTTNTATTTAGFRMYVAPNSSAAGYASALYFDDNFGGSGAWQHRMLYQSGVGLTVTESITSSGGTSSFVGLNSPNIGRQNAAANLPLSLQNTQTFTAAGNLVQVIPGTYTGASGQYNVFSLAQTYNETSTASDVDFLITRTESALGSGTHKFASFVVGATELFNVDHLGNVLGLTYNANLSSIATTLTDGLTVKNTTASTAGVPVQISPSIHLGGQVWNTTATAATNYVDWISYVNAVSGTTPTTTYTLASSLATTGTPAYTTRLTLSNSGVLGAIAQINPIAGTTTIAPIVLTSGTDLTSAAAGSFEYNGTRLAFSPSTTRKRIPLYTDATPTTNYILVGNGTDFTLTAPTGTGSPVEAASPTLSGTPLSTTAAALTNTTQIATTAFTVANVLTKQTLTAVNASATLTGAQVLTSISTTSTSAVAFTMPTATLLATAAGAGQGSRIFFTIDNSASTSSGAITLTLGSGMTSGLTAGLTVPIGKAQTYEIYFTSTTACVMSQIL